MEASPASAADLRRPHAWRTVWVLALVWTMAVFDRMVLLLLFSGIKASMGLSDTDMSLLHGFAFAISFSLVGIPLGYLADRLNRRNLLIAGMTGWSLATLACGLSHSFAQFFAARMAVGAFSAVLAPAAISMVADLFPTEKRGRPTALLLAASMFGGVLSNLVGGGLLDWFTHHPPPSLPWIGQPAAWQMALLGSGAASLIAVPALALIAEPEREVSPATGATFHLASHMQQHAAMFVLLFATFIIIAVSGQGLGNWWPAVFMRQGGLTPTQTGALLGGLSLVSAIGAALLGGWLSDWAARRDPQTGRLKLAAAGLAGQAVALLPLLTPHFVPGVMVTLAISVVLLGVVSAACYSLLPDLVPPQGRGLLIGLYQFVGNLIGFGLGPTAVALVTNQVLRDETRVADAMLLFGMPLLALAVILALLATPFVRRMREAAA
ncbi:MAG: MFS transporter [Sphingomonadales bacterium]|nr:MFS transporter [Sphingomonadales bacterium]